MKQPHWHPWRLDYKSMPDRSSDRVLQSDGFFEKPFQTGEMNGYSTKSEDEQREIEIIAQTRQVHYQAEGAKTPQMRTDGRRRVAS